MGELMGETGYILSTLLKLWLEPSKRLSRSHLVHYNTEYNNYTTPQLQLQLKLHYTSYTLQLQLHYTTLH